MLKKILIASDSYKESLSSIEVGCAIKEGFSKIYKDVEYEIVPVADGGEGTVDTLISATGGQRIEVTVKGPLGDEVLAYYGISGDKETAYLEMAKASGIDLVEKEKRNPFETSTYGTGQLLKDALDHNVKRIIIGIGGSATNDGGIGMLNALGVKFFDENNNEIHCNNSGLSRLSSIDTSGLDDRIKDIEIIVACDVDNPLCGPNGATYVYGPQKGAKENDLAILDENLYKYSKLVEKQLNIQTSSLKGAGAAGGLGFGLVSFLGARLESGIDMILSHLGFEESLKNCNLVITGEGRIDFQTVKNKAPIGVAKHAKKYNIPVIAISAVLGNGYEAVYDYGIDSVFSIVSSVTTLEEAYANTKENLEKTSESIARLLNIKM